MDTIESLRDENTRLRAALANSKSPCVYCSLPVEEWAKCQHGFPGCGRADDAMGCPELGAALELERLRAEMEWQPIETAPRGNNDFFLVCGVGDDRSPFVVRGTILWNARKANTPSHLHLQWLTHWSPLPAPPGDRTGETG